MNGSQERLAINEDFRPASNADHVRLESRLQTTEAGIVGTETTPAEELQNVALPGGWTAVERIQPSANSTGGHFSTQWIVERDGTRAFLKAIDIHDALRQGGEVMRVLQQVATEYNWERDLLQACADRGMNRIVRAIDSGEHRLRDSDPASVVFYLIFDLAKGDIRAVHEISLQLDLGRIFRALHDVAVGVQQLHAAGFTHQDVKPSNVLTYEEERELAKLGDLGRASRQDGSIGHDQLPFAGDRGHAPPEGLYGDSPPDWSGRRACDLYHLGSLVLYLFAGTSATAAWVQHLHPTLRPRGLGGSFEGSWSDALPYVRNAMQEVAEEFPEFGEDDARSAALQCFRELCDPDPRLRGDPRARIGHRDPYSVQRYVSLFNLYANRTDRIVREKSGVA
jgi:eukaryotic-like serine/threonine-protein kinase